MSRVITFSRTFPAYHPKAGQQTYFVEKFWKSLNDEPVWHTEECPEVLKVCSGKIMNEVAPKHHTIRAGNRWKVGDKFSPRVWSGKPYNSKQIVIAPDMEIKKVWDFKIKDKKFRSDDIYDMGRETMLKICANDGLLAEDFVDWFQYPKPFEGQIICWNENVSY